MYQMWESAMAIHVHCIRVCQHCCCHRSYQWNGRDRDICFGASGSNWNIFVSEILHP